jgi:hypothetical protein
MPNKRIPLHRASKWRITPLALQLWRMCLEIRSQGLRDMRGALSDEDTAALRDVMHQLSREVGFCRFTITPDAIEDEPWGWAVATGNRLQLARWQESREIRDLLNAALLQQAAQLRAAPRPKARAGKPSAPEPERNPP